MAGPHSETVRAQTLTQIQQLYRMFPGFRQLLLQRKSLVPLTNPFPLYKQLYISLQRSPPPVHLSSFLLIYNLGLDKNHEEYTYSYRHSRQRQVESNNSQYG